MKVAAQTVITSCPDCGEKIDLGPRPKEGQVVTCPECWAYLKVVKLNPLKLDWDTFDLEDDEEDDDDALFGK